MRQATAFDDPRQTIDGARSFADAVSIMTAFRAHALLVLAAFFWGCGNVAQKTVLEYMPPLMTTGVTSLLAALILCPFALREWRTQRSTRLPRARDFIVSALVFTAAVATVQIGYGGTSVTNAGFLVNASVALTPLAAWFILREKPVTMLGPSIALVVAGAWFMSGQTMTVFAWGDAVCLLAAALFSISVPLVGRFVTLYGRPAFLTCIHFVICGTICSGTALVIEPTSFGAMRAALPEIILIGVVAKGFAYLAMAVAQQFTSSSIAAILVSAEAVFGAFFANILLGEIMSGPATFGAVLIIASILVVQITQPAMLYRKGRGVALAALRVERRAGVAGNRDNRGARSAFDSAQ